MADTGPEAVAPGSLSIADLLAGAATAAIRDSAGEVSRAQGRRGVVYLNVELMLGDGGEPLWLNSSVYFQQKRHHKDNAARER
jgi:hypothetical protein